jgi:tetratricopeptide (TPR) repeat protein
MRALIAVLLATGLSACAVVRPPAPPPVQGPGGGFPAGTAQPPGPGATPVPAPPERPSAPPPRQFHLGPAASALVTQAHRQSDSGDYAQAAATLERALRIEPDNPLLWTELGRVCLGENNPAQADAMGRKALSLATGDPSAQAAAWRLIADSLRARGRDADAYDADRRAAGLTPH